MCRASCRQSEEVQGCPRCYHLLFTPIHTFTSTNLYLPPCTPSPFRPVVPLPSPPQSLLHLLKPDLGSNRQVGKCARLKQNLYLQYFPDQQADRKPWGNQDLPMVLEFHPIEGCWPVLKELFWRGKKELF